MLVRESLRRLATPRKTEKLAEKPVDTVSELLGVTRSVAGVKCNRVTFGLQIRRSGW